MDLYPFENLFVRISIKLIEHFAHTSSSRPYLSKTKEDSWLNFDKEMTLGLTLGIFCLYSTFLICRGKLLGIADNQDIQYFFFAIEVNLKILTE